MLKSLFSKEVRSDHQHSLLPNHYPGIQLSRRGFLRWVVGGLGATAALELLTGCGLASPVTFDDTQNGEEIITGDETEVSPSENGFGLQTLLADPGLLGSFAAEGRDSNTSIGLALAIAEMARLTSAITLDAMPASDKERFIREILPLLEAHGIGFESLEDLLILQKIQQPWGNTYYISNKFGKAFYVRLTPIENATAIQHVTHGLAMQQQIYDQPGMGKKMIFNLGEVTTQEGKFLATAAEDLGIPISQALKKGLISPDVLHAALVDYFAETVVPLVKAGVVGRDWGGLGGDNLLLDLDTLNSTGRINFNMVDFTDVQVKRFVKEAAVRHAYEEFTGIFSQIGSYDGISFQSMPQLSSFYGRQSFADLNISLLEQQVLPITLADEASGYTRAYLPLNIVETAGKTRAEINEQIDAITKRIEAGETTFTAVDGTQIELAERTLDLSLRSRVIGKVAQIARPLLRVIGPIASFADIVGSVIIADRLRDVLTTPEQIGYPFQADQVNQLPLDSMFATLILIKYNYLAAGRQLIESSPLTAAQGNELTKLGINVEAIYRYMASVDSFPIGLVNESAPQGLAFSVVNGQILEPTFLSALLKTKV